MNSPDTYYRFERREVSDLLPKHYSRVLEIGCGEGVFRNNLNQEHEYWGIEPVASAAEIARNKLDRVLVGTYQQVENQLPDNYFDLVICNDVIEHMPDHDEFFESIKQKLAGGGHLVASIPNVRYVWNLWDLMINKDWEYKDSGILDRTHLRFFTRKSLERTLRNHKYEIDMITGINKCKPWKIRNRLRYLIGILLFGSDAKYLQYGIRITYVLPNK